MWWLLGPSSFWEQPRWVLGCTPGKAWPGETPHFLPYILGSSPHLPASHTGRHPQCPKGCWSLPADSPGQAHSGVGAGREGQASTPAWNWRSVWESGESVQKQQGTREPGCKTPVPLPSH